ncbi:MAG: ATP-binding protein, partial [Pirellulaceae bacterium]
KCSEEVSNVVGQLSPGDRILLRFAASNGASRLQATSVEVLTKSSKLPGAIQLTSDVPKPKLLHCFVRAEGVVTEAIRFDNRFALELKSDLGNFRVYVDTTIESGRLSDLIGKQLTAAGTLEYLARGKPAIFLTEQRQLVAAASQKRVSFKPLTRTEIEMESARIAYLDSTSSIIAIRGKFIAPVFFESTFSDLLQSQDCVDVDCLPLGIQAGYSNSPMRYRTRLIEVLRRGGERKTPLVAGVPLPFQDQRVSLPSAFSAEGRLASSSLQGQEYHLNIDTNVKGMVQAVVAYSAGTNIGSLQPGDLVQLAGVGLPIASSKAETSEKQASWMVFVGDSESVSLLDRPITVNRLTLAFAVSACVALILGGLLFTRSLRRQVEARTRNLNAVRTHLATSFEAAREAVLLSETSGRISQYNLQLANMLGKPIGSDEQIGEFLERVKEKLDPPDLFDEFTHAILSGKRKRTIELSMGERIVTAYGSPIIDAEQQCLGHFWSFQDVTEKRKLEHGLIQAQKMEAVGQLSGGIAHDLNNVLTVIRSNLALLSFQADDHEIDISEFASPIEASVKRASDLTRQLLDFSRKSNLTLETIEANELMRQVVKLARPAIGEHIEVQVRLNDEPVLIRADEHRVEHVLFNLCINARDAIGEEGGLITVSSFLRQHPMIGECVCLTVGDSGSGMSESVQRKIFEPFFTTKKPGTGTGLGLSTALGIVHQHDGDIMFESKEGEGSEFCIYLPLCTEADCDNETNLPTLSQMPHPLKLLLVDDDKLLRDSGKRILAALGHEVVTASEGKEAIAQLESNPDVNVILLDLVMPEMGGSECFEIIRQRWPNIPVAISSGYSADRIRFDPAEPVEFLPKPYQISQLRRMLAKLVP